MLYEALFPEARELDRLLAAFDRLPRKARLTGEQILNLPRARRARQQRPGFAILGTATHATAQGPHAWPGAPEYGGALPSRRYGRGLAESASLGSRCQRPDT